jgi:hypothetical protein
VPTPADIDYLFNHLWPVMYNASGYRARCLANLAAINAVFARHPGRPNAILSDLIQLSGVGIPIGSGLLHACNRATLVPFDKYTTGYALQLGLIPDNYISSGNFDRYSRAIERHATGPTGSGSIEGFVRAASHHCRFPFAPV